MAAENNNMANGRWYSVHPAGVAVLDPNLHHDIGNLVTDLQLALHPQADASPMWVLRANQDYPDSVFLFAGKFVPERVDRFTMRMLRWRINNGEHVLVKTALRIRHYLRLQMCTMHDPRCLSRG